MGIPVFHITSLPDEIIRISNLDINQSKRTTQFTRINQMRHSYSYHVVQFQYYVYVLRTICVM